MKNLQTFANNQLTQKQGASIKGGATYNIFCEIYIGRQESKNEPIDQTVLNRLMKWDTGLNNYFANR